MLMERIGRYEFMDELGFREVLTATDDLGSSTSIRGSNFTPCTIRWDDAEAAKYGHEKVVDIVSALDQGAAQDSYWLLRVRHRNGPTIFDEVFAAWTGRTL